MSKQGARVIQVIETTLLRRGTGSDENTPLRGITQYWSLDGKLLAELDPCAVVVAPGCGEGLRSNSRWVNLLVSPLADEPDSVMTVWAVHGDFAWVSPMDSAAGRTMLVRDLPAALERYKALLR